MTALYREHNVQTSLSDRDCTDKIPQHEARDQYHHGGTLIVLQLFYIITTLKGEP